MSNAKPDSPRGSQSRLPRLLIFAGGLFLFGAIGGGWGAWQNLCVDCPSIAYGQPRSGHSAHLQDQQSTLSALADLERPQIHAFDHAAHEPTHVANRARKRSD